MRKPAPRWTLEDVLVDIAIAAVLLMGVGLSVQFASAHLDFVAMFWGK